MIANNYPELILIVEDVGFPIEANKPKSKRSNPQNALYWMWMSGIGDFVGYTKNDMHECFLAKFAPTKEVLDETIQITSSSMDSGQMTQYMNEIKRWAWDELEMVMPEPEDK